MSSISFFLTVSLILDIVFFWLRSYSTDIPKDAEPLNPNKPVSTLYRGAAKRFLHYKQDRCLTIRELARLQSFPDSHILPVTTSVAHRQICNAVPVGLAHAVGKVLMEAYSVQHDTRVK